MNCTMQVKAQNCYPCIHNYREIYQAYALQMTNDSNDLSRTKKKLIIDHSISLFNLS